MKQKGESFALVTPSYHNDLKLFELLAESVDRFLIGDAKHYVLVDQQDLKLFQPYHSDKRIIIPVESILPHGIYKIPGISKFRFSFKHLPIRKWILQQLVKLIFPTQIQEDNLIYIDSDVALIKPFDPKTFVVDGKLRMFNVPGKGNIPSHYKWHQTAGKLLGLTPSDYYGARYIGQLISWRRENVLNMHLHIENKTGKKWQEALCSCWNLSEYILYGVFCDQILKDQSKHYKDATNFSLEYWDPRPMTKEEEEAFIQKLQPEHFSVMISAKAKMDVEAHQRILAKLQKQSSVK